jgi:hypothetical protein
MSSSQQTNSKPLKFLPMWEEDEFQVPKRIKIIRLSDFLKERVVTNSQDETTTIKEEDGSSFVVRFDDTPERLQFINLIKVERDIHQDSFDKRFIEIPHLIQQPRFHLVVKDLKESFERKIQSFLQTKLNQNNQHRFHMLIDRKKDEPRINYVRFPQVQCKSYDQLKDIVDEFSSLNVVDVDFDVYDQGMPLPLSKTIWDNPNLSSLDDLFIHPNGQERFIIPDIEKPPKELTSDKLPDYVIPVFESLCKHKVDILGKGRSKNVWLVKCDSSAFKQPRGFTVCHQGMVHFKEWVGAISWQESESKLNFQCWGCPEKKWTSVGHLKYDNVNNQVNVRKTRSTAQQHEDELKLILKLNNQGQIIEETNPTTPADTSDPTEKMNPVLENKLREWKKLNEHTKLIKKGRTDNTYEYALNCNRCVIDETGHSDNKSKFLISYIKKTGRVRFKCLSDSCQHASKWVNVGFIMIDSTKNRIIKEELLITTPSTTSDGGTSTTFNAFNAFNAFNDQSIQEDLYETESIFDYKLLIRLSSQSPLEALHYINKYVARENSNLRIYCRTNHKLEWKLVTNELLEQHFKAAKTSEGKNIFNVWSSWTGMRMVSDVTFNPSPIKDPNVINTYIGFAVKPSSLPKNELQTIIDPWERHIFDIIANGDVELGNYIINFLARIFQKPWEKGIMSLIIKSEHGAGKNVLFDPIAKILDKYFLVLRNVESSFSKFTGRFEKTLLCIFDEAKCHNKAAISSIKSFITSPKVEIEKKFLEPVFVDNFTNFVFLSNEDWILDIESTERRFIVVEANNKYAGKMDFETKAYMDAVRYVPPSNLLQYLLERDLSNFDLVCNAPSTNQSINQKVQSLRESSDRWLYHLLSEPKDEPQQSWFEKMIPANDVKNQFQNWCKNDDNHWYSNQQKTNVSTLHFWKKIEKYNIIKKHTYRCGVQGYFVSFPNLLDLQKSFAFVCFKLQNHKILFP